MKLWFILIIISMLIWTSAFASISANSVSMITHSIAFYINVTLTWSDSGTKVDLNDQNSIKLCCYNKAPFDPERITFASVRFWSKDRNIQFIKNMIKSSIKHKDKKLMFFYNSTNFFSSFQNKIQQDQNLCCK